MIDLELAKNITMAAFVNASDWYERMRIFSVDNEHKINNPNNLLKSSKWRAYGNEHEEYSHVCETPKDFTSIVYKNRRITGEIHTLDGLSTAEMKCILVILLSKIPPIFIGYSSKTEGIHFISTMSIRQFVVDSIKK